MKNDMDTNTLMNIFHTPCGEVVVEDRNGDRLWFSLTENIYALKTDVPDGDGFFTADACYEFHFRDQLKRDEGYRLRLLNGQLHQIQPGEGWISYSGIVNGLVFGVSLKVPSPFVFTHEEQDGFAFLVGDNPWLELKIAWMKSRFQNMEAYYDYLDALWNEQKKNGRLSWPLPDEFEAIQEVLC